MPAFDGKPGTLRNIMTHTSGIEETARSLITGDPDDAITIDEYVKVIPTRIFEPGTTLSYSSYATTLAGYIVQRISGQSFDDYIDQHLLVPLEMQHANFRQPLPPAPGSFMAKGYNPGSDEPKAFEFVNPAPVGTLSAAGEDMGYFMIAHLQNGAYGNGRFLEAETAKQMHETALNILPPLNRTVLGFYELNINGHRVISHDGDTQWFHSELSLFLDDGVGLYVSFNSIGKDGAAQKIRSARFKGFADRYQAGQIPEGEADVETAKLHAKPMAGTYANSRRADYVFTSLTNLLGQANVRRCSTKRKA